MEKWGKKITPIREETETTPVIKQYLEIKQKHQDCLLFFRLGDFYELFFEDAKVTAAELGIVLTKKGGNKGDPVPMCGIPFHSYESYVSRLIKAGYKVAICEQLESPADSKKRGYKEIIKRDVVRIITQGTLIEDSLLDKDTYNYICSIYVHKNNIFVAWVDISVGDFFVESTILNNLKNILSKVNPKEILLTEDLFKHKLLLEWKAVCSIISKERYNYISAKKVLENFFTNQYSSSKINLESWETTVAGVLLDYILLTQKEGKPNILPPKLYQSTQILKIDYFTRRSLELDKNNRGAYKGSLKHAIDYTITAAGSRLLGLWLNSPSTSLSEINNRLDSVEFFLKTPTIRDKIRTVIKGFLDIERCISRISLNRSSPRDLGAIKESLRVFADIKDFFLGTTVSDYLQNRINAIDTFSDLLEQLNRALLPDLPVTHKSGGFIIKNYDVVLKSLGARKQETTNAILELQREYIFISGISSLKIQYNQIMGYFIEVSSKQASKMLNNKLFTHKQSLSNVVRYTTEALIELENILLKSQQAFLEKEIEIYQALCKMVLEQKDILSKTIQAISQLDILCAFAFLAEQKNLIKPVVDASTVFKIIKGRHLVIEESLRREVTNSFIANTCDMTQDNNLFLITGPNMSGKSTFLRQNIIMIILAQMGCFVPAEKAHIGITDAIFSRVGASDDLFQGNSTFMVEMLETSTILNNATEKSFIILDEIGRGTSTYDGLSIAFGVVEYIHNQIKARTLFATHYHELVTLEEKLCRLSCFTVKAKEWQNNIVFLHEVIPGNADKSYGIHVAKIAGMPKSVIISAQNTLKNLEFQNIQPKKLDLFSYSTQIAKDNIITPKLEVYPVNAQAEIIPTTLINHDNEQYHLQQQNLQELKNTLLDLDINNITPKEALDILFKLKQELK